MREVVIVVASFEDERERRVVEAFKEAIASSSSDLLIRVQASTQAVSDSEESLICPLTLNLPVELNFPGQAIYQACRDILDLRQQVLAWGYQTGVGDCWLPIVFTAKGPLYAEAICLTLESSYCQPLHISDLWRQPLYRLGYRMLRSLEAIPGVYLIQFGFRDGGISFDRVIPFPAAPALASVGVQVPNLFLCHWLCLLNQPIRDLTIIPKLNGA